MSDQLNERLVKVLGDRTAKALEKGLGLRTVGDLMRHYPRRYAERGELTQFASLNEGELVTVVADVSKVSVRPLRNRKGTMLEVILTDGTGFLSLTFFNQAWRERDLAPGRRGLFAGRVTLFRGKRQLTHPDYEMLDGSILDSGDPLAEQERVAQFAGALLPVYAATAKLPSWRIGQCVRTILDNLEEVADPLPASIVERYGYPSLTEALRSIHSPKTLFEAKQARERLIFEEAFTLQALLAERRSKLRSLVATPRLVRSGGLLEAFDAKLPFDLTRGQREVSAEIEVDLCQTHPMHRLLQGEVGSGKTVVALRAMLAVIDAGGQCALLAPTEVLAQQHFRSITEMLGDLAMKGMIGSATEATKVVLLTGSANAAQRRSALLDIASGEAGIAIGTHALLGDKVGFAELGLVVIDEQHRFGVEQRDVLRAKASLPPHLLVMTATPIPRTVAMTIFGDLDISTLREMPKGRSPIASHVIPELEKPAFLERAWQRIVEEVNAGRQAYIVTPRIGGTENETEDMEESADDLADELDDAPDAVRTKAKAILDVAPELIAGPLSGVRVEILHGRLPSDVKDQVMRDFSAGLIDVLIATTVIEVGVDVANATAMVILDADRFGVSQLHQLRGRVGRGIHPGLCLLVTDSAEGSSARDRLDAVAATQDGFELSRVDLEQRREGDVLGRAQSGASSGLRLLRVVRDEKLIEIARDEAAGIVEGVGIDQFPALAAAVAELAAMERSDYLAKV
ncbi:MAG TPA: ATP-dependent DNA helicase RecG [Candidatus Nanopelagicaceae bacterium]|nr:ATP-dependent DNA helicase RecG [Candidatus Nanopelagicaceae bacterium]